MQIPDQIPTESLELENWTIQYIPIDNPEKYKERSIKMGNGREAREYFEGNGQRTYHLHLPAIRIGSLFKLIEINIHNNNGNTPREMSTFYNNFCKIQRNVGSVNDFMEITGITFEEICSIVNYLIQFHLNQLGTEIDLTPEQARQNCMRRLGIEWISYYHTVIQEK